MEFEARVGIVPVELRPGVVIRIHGLPLDMTAAEAKKLGAVIAAYALPSEVLDSRKAGRSCETGS